VNPVDLGFAVFFLVAGMTGLRAYRRWKRRRYYRKVLKQTRTWGDTT
jgi:hypothetical protein